MNGSVVMGTPPPPLHSGNGHHVHISKRKSHCISHAPVKGRTAGSGGVSPPTVTHTICPLDFVAVVENTEKVYLMKVT